MRVLTLLDFAIFRTHSNKNSSSLACRRLILNKCRPSLLFLVSTHRLECCEFGECLTEGTVDPGMITCTDDILSVPPCALKLTNTMFERHLSFITDRA